MKATLALLPCAAVLLFLTGCGEPTEGEHAEHAEHAMSMPADESGNSIAVIAKLITAINQHDTEAIGMMFDDKYVDHNPMPGMKGTKEGTLGMFKVLFTAFPDSNCNVDLIFAKGDMVALKMTTTGTNTGEFMGKPATNKAVTFDEVRIAKVKKGKVVEHWGLEDNMTMMTQLGMMGEAK